MNKTALKNFATWSRRKLIEQVQTKSLLYGIDEKNGLHIEEQFGQLLINGQTYPLSMKSAFKALQKQIEQKGYKQLLEEAAYTWFNRIIAIRYMEVHEYLPERVNVLSSSVGRVDPDILFEYDTMNLTIKQEEIRELINSGNTEAAYRILFVAQCNALNEILPFMFEKIQDYSELLLPDFLLDAESVINTLVKNSELTESFEEIEVIGWLYQFYNTEPKDQVFANLKKNKKIEKYDIPAATQLFTPKWIVQYMVENSLGQLWLESNPTSLLKEKMKYYIKPAQQDVEVELTLEKTRYKNVNLEEIKILDPCVGSGHILVYAFDLLYEMYSEAGYPSRTIPVLILEKNLYGLDVDDRASQLASFALLMKGREKSRSILNQNIELNIYALQESNWLTEELIDSIADNNTEIQDILYEISTSFEDAKEYGSLLSLKPFDYATLSQHLNKYSSEESDLFKFSDKLLIEEKLPHLVNQANILSGKYDVVCTNPPYMGRTGMNALLTKYLDTHFKDSKFDLFSAFIQKAFSLAKELGFVSLITMESWMFLSSYRNFRENILEEKSILQLIHMPYQGRGRTSLGINFGTVATIFKNSKINNYIANNMCIRFNEIDEEGTPHYFPVLNERYTNTKAEIYSKIPGRPIAYWLSHKMLEVFSRGEVLKNIGDTRQGMATSDNNRFLRLWHEVEVNKVGLEYPNALEAKESKKKWFPYNKGGNYRKWFGNNEFVINYENDGFEVKQYASELYKSPTRTIKSVSEYFKPCLSWSKISSGDISFRFFPQGFIFDVAGCCIFFNDDKHMEYILSFLNSKISKQILQAISPTLNYEAGQIASLPLIYDEDKFENINILTKENISISKDDWDLFETSWNFKKHPMLNFTSECLSVNFTEWTKFTQSRFDKIKANEIKLNEIFIEIYDLKGEIEADVLDKEIKIHLADLSSDARSFLSYFIGCLVSRYSLDVEGIAFASGNLDYSKFHSFQPARYGMVQLTDAAYLENDIIIRLREFLSVAFSAATVDENIHWLAEALEMKNGEDPENRLRRYFMDEFFADHCKTYQKRPIYWLVDSGKQKGLRTLIYLHRYQPDTMATIRFEHLQEIQAKYQQEITDLENRLVNPNLSATDKKKLNVEKVSFEKKIEELREFDKRLAAIAAEEIEIDLDDGVKVNYEKFYRGGKGVLAKIK